MPRRAAVATLAFCLISLGLSSCAVTRRIHRAGKNPAQPLAVADKATLMAIAARNYNLVQNFSATVDMTPSVGSAEKNHINEYKDVTAHIYFRRPAEIRMLASYPVIGGTAFDMVSDGANFKVSIPYYNRFIEGRNDVATHSDKKLENLRPQHFLESLMVKPLPDDPRKVGINNLTDEEDANYVLSEIEEDGAGGLVIARSVWFSRIDLTVTRQIIYDDAGNPLSDSRYSDWHYFDLAPFPRHIEINRPQDDYGVVLDVKKMDINKGVSNERFVLNQPPGSTLQVIGEPPAPTPATTPPPRRGRRP